MARPDHPLAGRQTMPCRWCSARTPIVWCITTGKRRIPIEADPNPAGNVEIRPGGNPKEPPLAVVHPGPPGMVDHWTAYMPHHATCTRDTPEVTTP